MFSTDAVIEEKSYSVHFEQDLNDKLHDLFEDILKWCLDDF